MAMSFSSAFRSEWISEKISSFIATALYYGQQHGLRSVSGSVARAPPGTGGGTRRGELCRSASQDLSRQRSSVDGSGRSLRHVRRGGVAGHADIRPRVLLALNARAGSRASGFWPIPAISCSRAGVQPAARRGSELRLFPFQLVAPFGVPALPELVQQPIAAASL